MSRYPLQLIGICVAVLLFLGLIALSLRWPSSYVDHVQVLELGRQLVAPHSDGWSLMWNPLEGRPIEQWSSWGAGLHYFVFEKTGYSLLSTRILGVLWLTLLVIIAFSWLRLRGLGSNQAVLLTVLLGLEPNIWFSVFAGRVDVLPMLCVVFALWIFERGRQRRSAESGAAVLAGITPMLWASGLLLLPVAWAVLLEEKLRAGSSKWRAALNASVTGFLVVLTLVIAITWTATLLPNAWHDWRTFSSGVGGTVNPYRLYETLRALFFYNPVLSVLATFVLLRNQRWVTGTAFLLVLIVVSTERIYVFRLVYPIFLCWLLIGLGLTSCRKMPEGTGYRILLLIGILHSSIITLVVRPAIILLESTGRERQDLLTQLHALHKNEPKQRRIIDTTLSFYEHGMRAGWYLYYDNDATSIPLVELAKTVDAHLVILHTKESNLATSPIRGNAVDLARIGYCFVGELRSAPSAWAHWVPDALNRLYLGGDNSIGPLQLWSKQLNCTQAAR